MNGCGSLPGCWTARRWRPLCAEFGISRKTGYKILQALQRLRRRGADRPEPAAIPPRQPVADGDRKADRPAEARVSRPGARPRSGSGCGGASPTSTVPAISTVHAVLDRHGLVTRRGAAAGRAPRARRSSGPTSRMPCGVPTTKASSCSADRRYCYPLTDHRLRQPLSAPLRSALDDAGALRLHRVRAASSKILACPHAIRTDNGVPFASPNALYGLSKLSVWWLRLGIHIERIKPGHPEQNGRHERMHLTLKTEATKPAAANFLQQQARFDAFIDRYNQERPHQALGMHVPASSTRRRPRPIGGSTDLDLSVSRLDGHRHALRPHLLRPAQDQSESGLCRPEGGRAAR